jgi:hypothetical protein
VYVLKLNYLFFVSCIEIWTAREKRKEEKMAGEALPARPCSRGTCEGG